MSALVSASKALTAPERFSVIRLGVTDLDKTTVPFITRNDERMSTQCEQLEDDNHGGIQEGHRQALAYVVRQCS